MAKFRAGLILTALLTWSSGCGGGGGEGSGQPENDMSPDAALDAASDQGGDAVVRADAAPDQAPDVGSGDTGHLPDLEADAVVDTRPDVFPPAPPLAAVTNCAAGTEVSGNGLRGFLCLSPLSPAAQTLEGDGVLMMTGPIYLLTQ